MSHFTEVIGNGGVTLQILQSFEIYHTFVNDCVEAIKRDPEMLKDCLKELEEIAIEAGQIHPDLYITLNSVNTKIAATLSFIAGCKIAQMENKAKTKTPVKTGE